MCRDFPQSVKGENPTKAQGEGEPAPNARVPLPFVPRPYGRFSSFLKTSRKYSGRSVVNSIHSPVLGCLNVNVLA